MVLQSIKNSQGAVVTVPGRLLNSTTRRLDQMNVRLERQNYDHLDQPQRSSRTPSPVDDQEADPNFEERVDPEDLRIGESAEPFFVSQYYWSRGFVHVSPTYDIPKLKLEPYFHPLSRV